MSYPILSIEKAQELAELLRKEKESGGDPLQIYLDESEWCSTRVGDDYERQLVEGSASALKSKTLARIAAGQKLAPSEQYELEAQMASEVHAALGQLSLDMLEDDDFWRYVALFPYRWYLIAREPELQPQDFGGYVETENGQGDKRRQKKSLITQLLFRSFLWGKIAFEEDAKDPYERAVSIQKIGGPSIDVWHSHLIRTQLGQLGKVPHAFLDTVETITPVSEMKDQARAFEKRLARMKHSVLFDVYSYAEASTVSGEQLSRVS